MNIRTLTAHLIAPAMKLTGFRFSKDYRHSDKGWKAFVYRCVSTVEANYLAGMEAA